jgi:hypothetical protein
MNSLGTFSHSEPFLSIVSVIAKCYAQVSGYFVIDCGTNKGSKLPCPFNVELQMVRRKVRRMVRQMVRRMAIRMACQAKQKELEGMKCPKIWLIKM